MKLVDIYAKVSEIKKSVDDPRKVIELSDELIDKLNKAIAIEVASQKGGASEKLRYRCAMNLIPKDNTRPALSGAWEESDGLQYICNGYVAVRLTDKIAGLPDIPKDCKPMDVSSIFKSFFDSSAVTKIDVSFSLKDVKAAYDLAKAMKPKKSPVSSIKEGLFEIGCKVVNVEYLYYALGIVGEDAEVITDPNSEINAIGLRSNKGEVMLLPIRKGR